MLGLVRALKGLTPLQLRLRLLFDVQNLHRRQTLEHIVRQGEVVALLFQRDEADVAIVEAYDDFFPRQLRPRTCGMKKPGRHFGGQEVSMAFSKKRGVRPGDSFESPATSIQ